MTENQDHRPGTAAPAKGVGCHYCPKHPQATTYVHDQRGCLPVCQVHYAWRQRQSVIEGHGEGCRARTERERLIAGEDITGDDYPETWDA